MASVHRPSELYWRVAVMESGSGLSWRGAKDIFADRPSARMTRNQQSYGQQIRLDLATTPYLPALDTPTSFPDFRKRKAESQGLLSYRIQSSLGAGARHPPTFDLPLTAECATYTAAGQQVEKRSEERERVLRTNSAALSG